MPQNHNVYILGAGFSCDAGIPPVHPFLFRMQEAEETLRLSSRTPEADAIRDVLAFRLSSSSAAYRVEIDLDNIEDLFSLVSASARTDLAEKTRWAIAATIDHFKARPTLNLDIVDPTLTPRPHWVAVAGTAPSRFQVGAYELFLSAMLGTYGVTGAENTLITFNYDTVVEEAFAELGVQYTYGLKGNELASAPTTPACCVHPVTPTTSATRLLKLHGSMNWASGGGGVGAAGKAKLCASYADVIATGRAPVLVPPTWKKTFGAQLDRVWEQAVDSLRTATRVVIIGFSAPATDMHFRFLMAAGLQGNIALREVVVVNPDADGDVQRRMEALFSARMTRRGQLKFVRGAAGYTGAFFGQTSAMAAIGRWNSGMRVTW